MPNTTNFNWATPADTDLVKDGAAAIRTLGNSIDASLVDLKGGTTGQVLAKATNADLDFTWTNGGDITEVIAGTGLTGGGTSGAVTVSLSTPVSATNGGTAQTTYATGDLLFASATNTLSKRAIGTTGQVLTVSGGVPAWSNAASSDLTISQLASGTLSGATINVSGLSSYNFLMLRLINVDPASASQVNVRINNNSDADKYKRTIINQTGSTTNLADGSANRIELDFWENLSATSINNSFTISFENCKAAGFTTFSSVSAYRDSNSVSRIEASQGIYLNSEAVSSLNIFMGTGNFDGGSYVVYGG